MSAPLDLQLGRLDLLSMGANRRGCLRVLASSKGKKHKVITGGEDGVVQCNAVKKGETQVRASDASDKRRALSCGEGGGGGTVASHTGSLTVSRTLLTTRRLLLSGL